MQPDTPTFVAFAGDRRVAAGPIAEVAIAVQAWQAANDRPVLVFEDATGRQLDLDLRGTPAEALARLAQHPHLGTPPAEEAARGGPGRPKLGVVSREVSLLPRHWEWLNAQRGGASATIRALVEGRMKATERRDRARRAQEAAERFLWAMAGNLPGFEEATRALARREHERFDALSEAWPADVREHARRLLAIARRAEEAARDDAP